MDIEYQRAFTEVDEIFKLMPIDLLSKIPPKFRQIITENKDKDYRIKIEEPLEEKNLKKETVVILGLIYRDFIASPEERKQLQLKEAEDLKKIEEEMQKQYDINQVFDKRKNKQVEQNETELIVYKEPSFIKRFFNLIKGIFKKNKF